MRTSPLLCALLLLIAGSGAAEERAGDVSDERVQNELGSGGNWLVNGGRFTGEHFSPLSQIDPDNVSALGLAWSTEISNYTLVAEPIVVDGVIYLSANRAKVFAVDASSGAVLWKYDPKIRTGESLTASMWANYNRGVAVYDGRVFVGTGDCRLIALDAARGTPLWESQVCDIHENDGAAIAMAPRVADGKVFTGHSGSDGGVRGSVSAWDPKTGKELWRFWTVPGDPAKGFETPELEKAAGTWAKGWATTGGGANWEGLRYDPVTDLLFFGTASVVPLNVTMRGPGDNLFTNSILAVEADTGKYRWHYQTVPSDAWDYDASMPIVVADLDFPAGKRRVLMQAPKNGFFYVLDARTGELISADAIAAVTWASHIDPETGRPVEVAGARYYEGEEIVRVWPNASGSHNWHPMSFHPETGLVYIPVIDMPANFKAGGFFGARIETLGYGPEEEVPMGAGKLLAWDPVKRTARWSVEHPLPFNGGVLSTAGNLVFQGTGTGDVRAYRADTGAELWSIHTGSSMAAAPVTYRLDDEQYVLAAGGVPGHIGIIMSLRAASDTAQGTARLFAFKLGGGAEMPAARVGMSPVPKPPPRTATLEQLERGAGLWSDLGCELCHGAHVMGLGELRRDGAVPDLRYIPAEVHAEWHGIVLGGNRLAKGMPEFSGSIGVEDSEALQAYVIEAAWKAYEKQQTRSSN